MSATSPVPAASVTEPTAWTVFCQSDGMAFAVFLDGHHDLDLTSEEVRRRMVLAVMSLGYRKSDARDWVDAAELGQFWIHEREADSETGWHFCLAGAAGARPITGAKFL